MALINDMYILVTNESISNSYEKTNHPVEKGIPISDHIKAGFTSYSLSAVIVNTDSQRASDVYKMLLKMAMNGTEVRYVGRNSFKKAVITSIKKSDENTLSNGTSVDLDMEEIRFANSPYRGNSATTNTGTKQTSSTGNKTTDTTKKYHTVKKGETLWGISKKYGKPLKWIIDNNTLKSGNPNLIYPNEKIRVA